MLGVLVTLWWNKDSNLFWIYNFCSQINCLDSCFFLLRRLRKQTKLLTKNIFDDHQEYDVIRVKTISSASCLSSVATLTHSEQWNSFPLKKGKYEWRAVSRTVLYCRTDGRPDDLPGCHLLPVWLRHDCKHARLPCLQPCPQPWLSGQTHPGDRWHRQG